MTEQHEQFRAKVLGYFTGARQEIASRDLDRYLRHGFTGRWFEHFADTDHPNRITERDLIAIQMLSVTAPPGPTIWILEEGASQITELLEQIPTTVEIWKATDKHFAAANKLWDLLDKAKWPVNAGHDRTAQHAGDADMLRKQILEPGVLSDRHLRASEVPLIRR